MSQFAISAERWSGSDPRSPFRFSARRPAFLLLSLAFAGAFCWNYMKFQVVEFSWFNVYYTATPLFAWVAAFVIFLIPGIFVPTELVRPSSFAVLMQYMLVLMPVCFVPLFRQEMPLEHCLLLGAVFAAAILVLVAMNKAPRKILPIPRLRPYVAWTAFAAIYLVLNLIVVLTGPRWQLVSFADVYDIVRQQVKAYNGSAFIYAYMNLAWGMNPFLLAYAMCRKNYKLAAFSSLMEMYLYGYGGFKAMVFVPVLVIGSYLAVRHFRQAASKVVLTFFALTVLTTVAYVRSPSLLNITINGLYEMRTVGMAGQNAAGFDYFAYNHGFTYWSHLAGVNRLINYRFKEDIGNEVGLIEEGTATQANTGFLATDGLAAFGFAGVIIIAFVAGGYFWLVDCTASGHDSAFAVAAFSVPAFVLVNGGFFTSLLSDGALLILVLLQFMPLVQERNDRVVDLAEDRVPGAAVWTS